MANLNTLPTELLAQIAGFLPAAKDFRSLALVCYSIGSVLIDDFVQEKAKRKFAVMRDEGGHLCPVLPNGWKHGVFTAYVNCRKMAPYKDFGVAYYDDITLDYNKLKPIMEGYYRNDVPNGRWKMMKDSVVIQEGDYVDGQKHGAWKQQIDGVLTNVQYYKGALLGRWKKGKVLKDVRLEDGKLFVHREEYGWLGKIKSARDTVDGQVVLMKEFNAAGKLLERMLSKDGELGICETFDESGGLRSKYQCVLIHGYIHKHGEYIGYNQDGSIRKRCVYEFDERVALRGDSPLMQA